MRTIWSTDAARTDRALLRQMRRAYAREILQRRRLGAVQVKSLIDPVSLKRSPMPDAGALQDGNAVDDK